MNEGNLTALITGASSGIGYELAKILATKKFNLVLVARSKDKLEQLKSDLILNNNIKVMVVSMDLSLEENPKKLFDMVRAEGILVTHLINNAGFGDLSSLISSDWIKINEMLNLNIKSLTYLTYLFLPQLKKTKNSHILNVSSIAAFLPGPNMAVYYATKAYVQSFTEAIAEELKPLNIKVTSLCPGPTLSGFQEKASISLSSPLFKGVPSSKDVAEYAYNLLNKNKVIGVHGLKNRLMIFSLRFLPRQLIPKIVIKLQSSRAKN